MEKFDVFLCHNSKDKPAVIKVAEQLQQRGISPWLDIWQLRPGFSWQRALEQQIDQIGAAAVFVGGSGFGPWQSQEIDAFLRAFANKQCPVIPVLLPDAPKEPQLPLFLQGLMWVDFSLQYPEPMGQLIWGITGNKPGTTPIIQPPTATDNLVPQGGSQKSLVLSVAEVKVTHSKVLWNKLFKDFKWLLYLGRSVLASEKGIDYTRLRDFLAAKNWKKADKETYLVMIQAVGKKDGDWFTSDELLNFPCTDLRTIDRLWVEYSNGHFGFSVQKEIYLSVGGKADGKYDNEAWEKLGDRVGWRVERSWINYYSVTFDTSSLRGHLPMWVGFMFNGGDRLWRNSSLASRLVKCNI
ncbi:GUN4 domain-containing protein [Nostoc sp.]|uniref:GUN4 domain-containing protein n=1 Tax=Nostoc sp. TaxID=1180 RepID=UPI002FF8936A